MRSNSSRLLLGGIFLLVVLATGVQAGRMALFAFAPARAAASSKEVIEIHKGQGPQEIARLLASKNAVSDPKRFVWLGRLTRQWKKIKAGEYEVSPSMSPIEVFGVITSGISIPHPVTVREGENMYEIAADIESKRLAPKAQVVALCKDPKFIGSLGLKQPQGPTLEGYLFPDTYFFNRAMTAEDMVRQMVHRLQQAWSPQDDARARALGLSQLQVLTLASIVEKETGAPQDRPLISSVLHNRLRKRMRLQSDPTTIYGMWERYQGNIHRSDLLAVNDYNTYTLPGLPVGPISNPGKEAIEAALNPVQSNYIFFVSHNDGTTEFTATLEEHNRAVRKFQMDPKAREGKSWRSLRKNTAASAPASAAAQKH
jgi:UPF0755 protein